MAIARRFKISHYEVFPHGAYIVSPVTAVLDFEQSTREVKVQQADKATGELIWSMDVLDADPEAPKKSKTVSIKFLAKVQPVPPANDSASPFTPVEFEGLTALAYIDDSGNRSRIAWSFRAEAMHSPGKTAAKAATSSEGRAA
ncbi:plasmid replication, integration and excision activator [Phycicoccus sp. HDW14]|uniref:plasmid replication, integration and excision activator n=1 Tax=Phycicoccus sp. HDW14 TaxID=2714941 RepID=UPI00140850CC|nr:plasmid replication, integration and excision activator [Phycicoccus sp. HDW14]QIM22009.1 plasmid replication, integration and excision activator [Phycicoccus sp. HDW14]